MRCVRNLFSTIILIILVVCAISAQTTEFTYQGSLKDGVNLANGNYDFEFALFSALSLGIQIGPTVSRSAIPVSGGIFSVSLDFGDQYTGGFLRFLEIRVRPTGGGSFNTLSPRQQIDSAPFSVKSLTADSVTTGGIPAGSGNYIQNTTSPQTSSNFNISGDGTAGGTLNAFVVNATSQYNLGGSRVLSVPLGSFSVFVGPGAGQAGVSSTNTLVGADAGRNTTFAGNSFFGYEAGYTNNQGARNSFFGRQAGRNIVDGSDNTMIGRGAGGTNLVAGSSNTFLGAFSEAASVSSTRNNATAIGFRAAVAQDNSLILGSINGVNGATADTNVGIGTTAPASKLHVADNSGQVLFGGGGCNAGHVGIGFASTLTCSNYSILGNGTDTLINRPNGGSIHFREGNVTQMVIQPGGIVQLFGLGAAGGVPLCFNPFNQISLCSSSLRYKTNINRFSQGMSFVQQLHPITFDWKEGGMKDVGFGAEDIEKIDPRFVTYNDKGEVEGVKYDRLSVAFVNAFKEQQKQIEEQRSEIRNQQSAINDQQNKIDALLLHVKEQKAEIDALKALVYSQNETAEICRPKN